MCFIPSGVLCILILEIPDILFMYYHITCTIKHAPKHHNNCSSSLIRIYANRNPIWSKDWCEFGLLERIMFCLQGNICLKIDFNQALTLAICQTLLWIPLLTQIQTHFHIIDIVNYILLLKVSLKFIIQI